MTNGIVLCSHFRSYSLMRLHQHSHLLAILRYKWIALEFKKFTPRPYLNNVAVHLNPAQVRNATFTLIGSTLDLLPDLNISFDSHVSSVSRSIKVHLNDDGSGRPLEFCQPQPSLQVIPPPLVSVTWVLYSVYRESSPLVKPTSLLHAPLL